jgi:XTP/dITP diphosphohydrolase
MNHNNKIVLASSNQKKLAELLAYLPDHFTLLTQSALDIPSPEETGTTFIENAIIKARNAAQLSGLPAIADDSGLEVDALQGQPGIYSSRYAGVDATDSDNNSKLLAALAEVPDAARTARFHCVIVLLRHALDPVPMVATGCWPGVILRAPQGNQGFGYDPLFFDPKLERCAADLRPEEKIQVSHRGQALRQLKQLLAAEA